MDVDFSHIEEILLHIPLFGAMTKPEVEELLKLFTLQVYQCGDTVIEEGGSPNNLYIIKKGCISVLKNNIELIRLNLGDSFGEVELIGIIPYIASCIASEKTEILILPKKNLYALKKSNPEFFIKLILNMARECCRRLAKADNFIIHNLEISAEDGDYY